MNKDRLKMPSEQTNKILGYLEQRRRAMVALLEDLAKAESPSNAPDANDRVLTLLDGELERADMRVKRIRGREFGGTIYARSAQRDKKQPAQLLVGHCDTVWPIGTLETMPVFDEDDVVKGPGVFDMKGGLVQMIYALRAIHDLRLSPPAVPVVVINSDEEVGSRESRGLIRRLAKCARRAFILEPAFGSAGKLKTARKTVGRFHVTVKGRAAHAGVSPEEGVSAILEMSYQIQQLFSLNDPARGITVNVGTIDGGLRPNVVAPRVEAVLDVRVPTQRDAEEVEAAIRNLKPMQANAEIQIEGGFGRPPMEPVERNLALWRVAQRLAREELEIELDHAAVGGASDGNTTSQYTATLDGLGAVGDGAHALHEHVYISKMPERTALLALLLLAPLVRDDA